MKKRWFLCVVVCWLVLKKVLYIAVFVTFMMFALLSRKPNHNCTYVLLRYQTPGTIVFTWDLPTPNQRNGVITMYELQFSKNVILNNDFKHDKNITDGTRIVFTGLEENMDYTFKVSGLITCMYAKKNCKITASQKI